MSSLTRHTQEPSSYRMLCTKMDVYAWKQQTTYTNNKQQTNSKQQTSNNETTKQQAANTHIILPHLPSSKFPISPLRAFAYSTTESPHASSLLNVIALSL